jgi:hypothetical protein
MAFTGQQSQVCLKAADHPSTLPSRHSMCIAASAAVASVLLLAVLTPVELINCCCWLRRQHNWCAAAAGLDYQLRVIDIVLEQDADGGKASCWVRAGGGEGGWSAAATHHGPSLPAMHVMGTSQPAHRLSNTCQLTGFFKGGRSCMPTSLYVETLSTGKGRTDCVYLLHCPGRLT